MNHILKYPFQKIALVVYLLWSLPVAAQSIDSSAVLLLKSNLGDALVFADSQYVGKADDQVFRLQTGVSQLRLVPPRLDSWSIAPEVRTLTLSSEDTLSMEINFPYHYTIESIPYEANVYWEKVDDRILLGSTPLLYSEETPVKGMLLVTLDGYESVRLTPGEDIWNVHRVELNPVGNSQVAERYWHPEGRSNRWIDYAAGGVAIVSGILAVRYKTKANRRYDRYELSGNPELRSGFEKYDRYSAISLGAMQVGIGVLAIRFVLK